MSSDLSRIDVVPVRSIWPHEAHHFTAWLLSNADVLGEVLGMELELTAAEHRVGGFALDLIGHDPTTGATVIVENQLEQTDHSHLGQLLTYAGGTDPSTIIWCAPSFREEHRAALDWLNEHTDEDTRFFGVEISAIRIDDSRPAPLFRLVAQPNDWTKQVHAGKAAVAVSGKAAAYTQFWSELLERIRTKHPSWTTATAGSKLSWTTIRYGTTGIWYGLLFTANGPAVELYFGSSSAQVNAHEYEKFIAHRKVLDDAMMMPVHYEPLPDKKASRARVYRPEGGDVLDVDDHEAFYDWFISTLEPFRNATQHIRALVNDDDANP